MTRRSSSASDRNLEDSVVKEKPVRKRIRDNHNELERVRRNNQKAQLEALRMALPFQDMDEKASMVSIFIRAREYIGMLEQRIVELQSEPGIFNEINAQQYPHHHAGMPVIQQPHPKYSSNALPTFTTRDRQLSVNPEHVQIHHGVPFYNPGFLVPHSAGMEMNSYVPSPMTSSPTQQKTNSPLSDQVQLQNFNADTLRNFVSDTFLKTGNVQRLSSDEETNLLKTFCARRQSSLILPLEDETVMIRNRDSFSALFSGILPDLIDTSVLQNSGEINCNKCQKGMCNMIMIDCDRCHKWYHIKCAKIDSDAIPTHWNCCQ